MQDIDEYDSHRGPPICHNIYSITSGATQRWIAGGGSARNAIVVVAEQAGCSVGTIYKHFTNKDTLLEVQADAVRREVLQEFDGNAQIDWLRGQSLDDIELCVTRAVVHTVRVRRELVRALLLRRLQAPDSMRPLQQANQLVVAAAIERSQPYRPAHLDPATFETRFRVAHQMVVGTMVNILVSQPGPLSLDDDDLAEQLARPMLAYLRAP